jgi:hypothetical protein
MGEKMQFVSVVDKYNLVTDGEIYHRYEKAALVLPDPFEIVFDPFQATVIKREPDECEMNEPEALDLEALRPIACATGR